MPKDIIYSDKVEIKAPIEGRIRVWFNEDLESTHFIVPGIIAIIIMIVGALLTSLVIAREYENGTMVNDTRIVRDVFLPLQERNGNNNIIREYLWGLNMGGGIGGLLNLKQGGQDYSYLYDAKGNVTTLLDVSQAEPVQGHPNYGTVLAPKHNLTAVQTQKIRVHGVLAVTRRPLSCLGRFSYREEANHQGRQNQRRRKSRLVGRNGKGAKCGDRSF